MRTALEPVERSAVVFGLGASIAGGHLVGFDVDADDNESAIAEALSDVISVEPNAWFTTVEQVWQRIQARRTGKLGRDGE